MIFRKGLQTTRLYFFKQGDLKKKLQPTFFLIKFHEPPKIQHRCWMNINKLFSEVLLKSVALRQRMIFKTKNKNTPYTLTEKDRKCLLNHDLHQFFKGYAIKLNSFSSAHSKLNSFFSLNSNNDVHLKFFVLFLGTYYINIAT